MFTKAEARIEVKLYIFLCMANSPPRLGEYAYAGRAGQGGLAVSQVITAETRDGHLKL